MLEELARQLDLRPAAQRVLALLVVEHDGVLVTADPVLRQVGGNQRQVLLRALFLRMLRKLLALRGKADAEGRLGQRRYPGEDVGIFFQLERKALAVALLKLLICRIFYSIVGDRGDRDEHIAAL